MSSQEKYRYYIKGTMDFLLALFLCVSLSPLMLLIACTLMLCGCPVLFRQTRPGLDGEPFEMYKFTSLKQGNPSAPFRFGKFLRTTSLDELPQLFNILKGQMSFIGPRPLLMEYLSRYTEDQMKRHAVKPGITGWAQVNGRNLRTLDEKVSMDLHYVKHQSLMMDLKILLKTFGQLFYWKEADFHQSPTLKPFQGLER